VNRGLAAVGIAAFAAAALGVNELLVLLVAGVTCAGARYRRRAGPALGLAPPLLIGTSMAGGATTATAVAAPATPVDGGARPGQRRLAAPVSRQFGLARSSRRGGWRRPSPARVTCSRDGLAS
jgi:hypothetical protein